MTIKMSFFISVLAGIAVGNNVDITDSSLVDSGKPDTVDVQFTVSWDNSWRATWMEPATANVSGAELAVENWDAAWVFIKWRNDDNGDWSHASLAATGHSAPDGTIIKVSKDGRGAFIYRSAPGSGSFTKTVKLRWNRVVDGAGSPVDISVNALEMIYVPQGSFEVGTGSIVGFGSFTDGSWVSGATIPFLIPDEGALKINNAAGSLWGTSSSGDKSIGRKGTLPAAFPKGYNAFYCMKYELQQGQYADFLNLLTSTQAAARHSISNAGCRYTISGSHPNYSASVPHRACNFLNWQDGACYAAWAGLRPMTELEYEKACRGPLHATAEYAWGDNSIVKTIKFANAGTADEAPLPSNANCVYGSGTGGPIRVGAFATSTGNRKSAGATYWGIMEMSGNLWERPISVGMDAGRSFTGLHGAGSVNMFPAGWPTTSAGYGVRGGAWNSAQDCFNLVSDRSYACVVNDRRSYSYGWRGVRTAP